jgi:hypothetical protein
VPFEAEIFDLRQGAFDSRLEDGFGGPWPMRVHALEPAQQSLNIIAFEPWAASA